MRGLEGTLACDGEGRPLVLHHGTFGNFERFGKTNDIGFHFGSRDQALERESQKAGELRREGTGKPGEWRVLQVALAARKTLVVPDDPRDWTNWTAVHLLAVAAGRHLLDLVSEKSPEAARQRR